MREIAPYVHWITKCTLFPLRQLPRFLGYCILTGIIAKDLDQFTILSDHLPLSDGLYVKTRKLHGHRPMTICFAVTCVVLLGAMMVRCTTVSGAFHTPTYWCWQKRSRLEIHVQSPSLFWKDKLLPSCAGNHVVQAAWHKVLGCSAQGMIAVVSGHNTVGRVGTQQKQEPGVHW